MSHPVCKPKNAHDIQRTLVAKPLIPHSEYEYVGPYNKYRQENYEIYQSKLKDFKANAEAYKNENIKALSHQKEKIGDRLLPEEMEQQIRDIIANEVKPKPLETKVIFMKKKKKLDNGQTLRRRYERYYDETWSLAEKLCNYEPWFRRYLILCRFIAAVRKIIMKNRYLKSLAKLRKVTSDSIAFYETQYIRCEHQSYPEIFNKFTEI